MSDPKIEITGEDVGPLIKDIAGDLYDQREERRRGTDRFSLPKNVPCLLEPFHDGWRLTTMSPLPFGIGTLVTSGEDEEMCTWRMKGELGHALFELGIESSLASAADVAIKVDFTAHRIIT